MLIVLLRHAEREYRPDRAEAEQVLTAKGLETAHRTGEKLAERLREEGRSIGQILTSPYARAAQTAALVAPLLGLLPEQIRTLEALRPEEEGSVDEAQETLLAASTGVMVVGHGPDLARLSRRLCGLPVELKKAQAIAIEWNAETGRGELLWQVGHKAGHDKTA